MRSIQRKKKGENEIAARYPVSPCFEIGEDTDTVVVYGRCLRDSDHYPEKLMPSAILRHTAAPESSDEIEMEIMRT